MPIASFIIFIVIFIVYIVSSWQTQNEEFEREDRNSRFKERERISRLFEVTREERDATHGKIIKDSATREEIYTRYAEDFEYALGTGWKEEIEKEYINDEYDCFKSNCYHYWVYRLVLADTGKVDSAMTGQGYRVGTNKVEEVPRRFAQRVVMRFNKRYPNERFGIGYSEKYKYYFLQFASLIDGRREEL